MSLVFFSWIHRITPIEYVRYSITPVPVPVPVHVPVHVHVHVPVLHKKYSFQKFFPLVSSLGTVHLLKGLHSFLRTYRTLHFK